jgi:hypothetical protein
MLSVIYDMGKQQTLIEKFLDLAKELDEKYAHKVAIVVRDGEVHASLAPKGETDKDIMENCTVVVRTKIDGSLEVLKRRQ